jgi:hypothetical protein
MNEILDTATVADEFSLAGIEPALTFRLADAVRAAGAAAVHVLGAGAFADWKTSLAVNALIARALDTGATREAIAADLEVVAEVQSALRRELALH